MTSLLNIIYDISNYMDITRQRRRLRSWYNLFTSLHNLIAVAPTLSTFQFWRSTKILIVFFFSSHYRIHYLLRIRGNTKKCVKGVQCRRRTIKLSMLCMYVCMFANIWWLYRESNFGIVSVRWYRIVEVWLRWNLSSLERKQLVN